MVIIFLLASQYLSTRLALPKAAQVNKWARSWISPLLQSSQWGLCAIFMRWRCGPRQSWPTRRRKLATAVFLGQSGGFDVMVSFHCWSMTCSSSLALCACLIFRWILVAARWKGILFDVAWRMFVAFFSKKSAASLPVMPQWAGIHCSATVLLSSVRLFIIFL